MNTKHWARGALLFSLALLGLSASAVPAQEPPPPDLSAAGDLSPSEFIRKAKVLIKEGEWVTLQKLARAQREARPNELFGWDYEGFAAYNNGDITSALEAMQVSNGMRPSEKEDKRIETARQIRQMYPGIALKPLEFVESDALAAGFVWQNKATALLAAKDYDEIERVASELQRSREANVQGVWFLEFFFDGLARTSDDSQADQRAFKEWRAARPDSILARIAEAQYWTRATYRIRGGGAGSGITPETSRKMDETLANAARIINEMPASANNSPLWFVTLQDWARLSGAGRGFLDPVFREGTTRFPGYGPIYFDRMSLLLPRWFGAPGEWEQMARERADKIGGTEGDIFYAQIWMAAYRYVRSVVAEPGPSDSYDMTRFWRGFDALRARYPDSVSLRTAQIQIAYDQAFASEDNRDFERAKSAWLEPEGNLMDKRLVTLRLDILPPYFGARRMETLVAPKPIQQF